MEKSDKQHILAAIQKASVIQDPWPHVVVNDVFPQALYDRLLEEFPDQDSMVPLSTKTTLRYVYWLEVPKHFLPIFWGLLRTELFYDLWDALQSKFGVEGKSCGAELCLDLPGYHLGPHTDTSDKLITAIFYLQSGKAVPPGTVLYHNPTPDTLGKGHKLTKEFKKVKTIPFQANSLFFFKRTNTSYHGVEKTKVQRRTLAFDVFV